MINNTIIMTDNSGEVSVTKDIKLYTVQEVADILGVNKTAIYGLVKRGELPAIKQLFMVLLRGANFQQ